MLSRSAGSDSSLLDFGVMPALRYNISLLGHKNVARDTALFCFSKPKGFSFVPGQHCEVSIPNLPEPDARGARRDLSFASAPYEEEVCFLMRMRESAFKHFLVRAKPGEEFVLEGPFGSLRLPEDRTKPIVLIAGGVGIAPFMSMLRQEEHEGFLRNITLIYANKFPADAAFLRELYDVASAHPHFVFVPTMTGSGVDETWSGERGRIGQDVLARYVLKPSAAFFYIASSPGMVADTERVLMQMSIAPENIRTEEFAGY